MNHPVMALFDRMNLKEKTTFMIVGLSGAMIIMLVFVSLVSFREFSIATAKDHVRSVAEVIRVGLTESMINQTIDKRDQFLKRLAEIEVLSKVRVIRGPEVVHQHGPGLDREQTVDAIDQQVLTTGEPYFSMANDANRAIFRGTIPFIASDRGTPNCLSCHQTTAGKVLGVVTIYLSMDTLRSKALMTIGFMLSIVILFSLFLAFSFRRLIAPVVATAGEVQKVVARATAGDFSGKIAYHGQDEMGLISRDFNRFMQHLQINLGTISSDVAKLIRYTIKDDSNLVTVTTEMVETLLEVAQFKQFVEEDNSTEDVYFRISRLLKDKFGLAYFSIYEVHHDKNTMKAVVVDGELGRPCRWCHPRVLSHADACRAFHTRRIIDSYANPFICGQFDQGEASNNLGHLCLPVFHSGHVGSVIQLVTHGSEGPVYQFLLPFISTFLRESAPTVEAKRLLDALRDSALKDPLTGLNNRRFLNEYEKTLVATTKRKNSALSVLLMDLDHFKQVNDTYGHDVGDTVLKAFAVTLTSQVRTSDIVIRYGGEEFMVILQENLEYTGPQLAEKIRVALEKLSIRFAGGVLKKTVSIGVAGFPMDGEDLWDVIKAADLALYAAKKRGRNCWVRYDAGSVENNT